jgi:hypothetical protein
MSDPIDRSDILRICIGCEKEAELDIGNTRYMIFVKRSRFSRWGLTVIIHNECFRNVEELGKRYGYEMHEYTDTVKNL